jgi:hypothetical protein
LHALDNADPARAGCREYSVQRIAQGRRAHVASKRLKELEESEVFARVPMADGGHTYHLTDAGRDVASVVEAMGIWGQRWVKSEPSLRNLDPSLLMWDMRRNLDPKPMPERRCVIQFCIRTSPPESGDGG